MQFNLLRQALNLRVDLGAERESVSSRTGTTNLDTFIFGLGLPYKIRLHKMVALIGGSTYARSQGAQPLSANHAGTTGIYGSVMSSDLLVVQAGSVSVAGSSVDTVAGALHLPIGIQVQPHPVIAFAVRTGYRLLFSHSQTSGGTNADVVTHTVPLTFEAIAEIVQLVEIGFAATIYGVVGGSGNIGTITVTVNGNNYAGEQKYDFWIGGRF
jgi:hypothetical protein